MKKPPKTPGPRGAADWALFGSDWTVRRTSLYAVPLATGGVQALQPASVPGPALVGPQGNVAVKARRPGCRPCYQSLIVDRPAARDVRTSVAGR